MEKKGEVYWKNKKAIKYGKEIKVLWLLNDKEKKNKED